MVGSCGHNRTVYHLLESAYQSPQVHPHRTVVVDLQRTNHRKLSSARNKCYAVEWRCDSHPPCTRTSTENPAVCCRPGWRQWWRLGREKKLVQRRKRKNPLDSDRPSHGDRKS